MTAISPLDCGQDLIRLEEAGACADLSSNVWTPTNKQALPAVSVSGEPGSAQAVAPRTVTHTDIVRMNWPRCGWPPAHCRCMPAACVVVAWLPHTPTCREEQRGATSDTGLMPGARSDAPGSRSPSLQRCVEWAAAQRRFSFVETTATRDCHTASVPQLPPR